MSRTWVVSDWHLGHKNIIKFVDGQGNRIRPFETVEEHDEALITYHNELVSPGDRVYVLGDVAISKKALTLIKQFNGRLKLVRGNHDVFKLIDYIPYFDDVVACRVYPEHKLIMTHIPIHHQQLKGGGRNIHGHLHQNVVIWDGKPDTRYINVCVEHTGMKPILLDSLL